MVEDRVAPLSDDGAAVETEGLQEKAEHSSSDSVPASGVLPLPSPVWCGSDLLGGKAGHQCCARTVGTRVR